MRTAYGILTGLFYAPPTRDVLSFHTSSWLPQLQITRIYYFFFFAMQPVNASTVDIYSPEMCEFFS